MQELGQKLFRNRTVKQLGSEWILKIIWFQLSSRGKVYLPLDQAAQRSIQPGLLHRMGHLRSLWATCSSDPSLSSLPDI